MAASWARRRESLGSAHPSPPPRQLGVTRSSALCVLPCPPSDEALALHRTRSPYRRVHGRQSHIPGPRAGVAPSPRHRLHAGQRVPAAQSPEKAWGTGHPIPKQQPKATLRGRDGTPRSPKGHLPSAGCWPITPASVSWRPPSAQVRRRGDGRVCPRPRPLMGEPRQGGASACPPGPAPQAPPPRRTCPRGVGRTSGRPGPRGRRARGMAPEALPPAGSSWGRAVGVSEGRHTPQHSCICFHFPTRKLYGQRPRSQQQPGHVSARGAPRGWQAACHTAARHAGSGPQSPPRPRGRQGGKRGHRAPCPRGRPLGASQRVARGEGSALCPQHLCPGPAGRGREEEGGGEGDQGRALTAQHQAPGLQPLSLYLSGCLVLSPSPLLSL